MAAVASKRSPMVANPSPAYQAAVQALIDLESAEGTMDRAAAEALVLLHEAWLSRKGWHRDDGPQDLRRVANPRRRGRYVGTRPEWQDHVQLYRRGDELMGIVEPYGLSMADLRSIVAFADREGLDVTIDERNARWFPGWTVPLCFTRRATAKANSYSSALRPSLTVVPPAGEVSR